MTALPAPATTRGLGHLKRWTFAPIALLEDGAQRGPVFALRLWRRVIVGYRPDWNRAVLTDLETFRSKGSLSDLTPYLAAGVVHADVPVHDRQRKSLNPHFHSMAVRQLTDCLRNVVEPLQPNGEFDALAWSNQAVRHMLNAAFFGGTAPQELLSDFLRPLEQSPPAPLLPRPRLFRRTTGAIEALLATSPVGTLAASLAGHNNAAEEIRVALAAGYDTTAHTLAWALWHLAADPVWFEPSLLPDAIAEVLRLYPAGWIGSRVTARPTAIGDLDLPARTLIMYSPYLTHRDPALWYRPAVFDPSRFAGGLPAWGYIPFGAGRRTCLGAHLARLMLTVALESLSHGNLRQLGGDPSIRTAIALRPAGPLRLEWRARRLAGHTTGDAQQ